MLPFQIVAAINNFPSKSLQARARDSIRERPQSNPGLPVVGEFHGRGRIRVSEKLTSYHTIKDELANAGSEWADSEAVVDRNWVSSRQPIDIPKFNEELKELFWGGARNSPARRLHFK
jgi:protease I